VRAAFEQRRKTLPNALSAVFGELTKEEITEIITSCGHSADIRGEKLGVAEFSQLSDSLYTRIKRNCE
jgi:16S rRNA (adenine1518-N6/adenine1519-N6)-dimethyltransferase